MTSISPSQCMFSISAVQSWTLNHFNIHLLYQLTPQSQPLESKHNTQHHAEHFNLQHWVYKSWETGTLIMCQLLLEIHGNSVETTVIQLRYIIFLSHMESYWCIYATVNWIIICFGNGLRPVWHGDIDCIGVQLLSVGQTKINFGEIGIITETETRYVDSTPTSVVTPVITQYIHSPIGHSHGHEWSTCIPFGFMSISTHTHKLKVMGVFKGQDHTVSWGSI